jgi:hypothetical protein
MPNNFSGSENLEFKAFKHFKKFKPLNQKRRVISPALCRRWNPSHSNRVNFVMFAEGTAWLNGN